MTKKILLFFILTISVLIIGGGIFTAIISRNLPDPALMENRRVSQSTKIYDRTGQIPLYEIHGEEKRTIIPFAEVPDYVKKATLTIEDANFYNHSAFDWRSILRAFFVNLAKGRIAQGGSTITQQLAKNAFLTPERTVVRKIKELLLAFRLEKKYSKDEIFDLYLNQIPYGANAYGIEAASQTYFKKFAKNLNLAEAALLASLPKAPSYYSPWGAHVDELMNRKDYILKKMSDSGLINEEELKQAKKFQFVFASQITGIKAPHFVIAIQEYLINKYGEDFIRTAGLTVTTTLDWELQQLAEKVVLEGAKRNEELYQGTNAALVAQDAVTGQILALVGSRDYFDKEIDGNFNVATQGLRQPGSAIKPFAYLTAFKKGFAPETVVFDVPTEFSPNNPKCPPIVDFSNDDKICYHPQNFDDKFRGPVSLREGLAQSINIPSAKVLYLAGIDEFLKTVKDFGITTLTERSRYGLSLVLGGGEVKLVELIGAYSVLAQEGIKHKQSMITQIKDDQNKILEEYKDQTERVIESQYSRLINDILSDIEARSSLFVNSLPLTVYDDQEVALKTGTTNDYKDAWAIGYTPSLVVGVWAGNNDNQPMQKRGSSILAAIPIWNAFLKEALKSRPPETFNKPEITPIEKPVLKGQYPEIHNILFYVDKKNPTGPNPRNPENDPQFLNWETAVMEWAKTAPSISKLFVNPSVGQADLNINLISPANGNFISNNQITVDAQISSNADINKIEIYFNNVVVAVQNFNFGKNYRYSAILPLPNPQLQNRLKMTVKDISGSQVEKEVILYSY